MLSSPPARVGSRDPKERIRFDLAFLGRLRLNAEKEAAGFFGVESGFRAANPGQSLGQAFRFTMASFAPPSAKTFTPNRSRRIVHQEPLIMFRDFAARRTPTIAVCFAVCLAVYALLAAGPAPAGGRVVPTTSLTSDK